MTDVPQPQNRKARPETEDFGEKYADEGRVSVALINRYFGVVGTLTEGVVATLTEGVVETLTEDVVETLTEGAVETLTEGAVASPLSILEIGCGEGHSTIRLRSMFTDDVEFSASEYVARQVEVARSNNPGVAVSQEDVYALDRGTDSLDVVYLLEVLEHLDDPIAALHEIRRVLKPTGSLILGVPREPLWRVLNMARLKYLRALGNTPGHLGHWSSRGISRLVAREFGPVVTLQRPLPWTILHARLS